MSTVSNPIIKKLLTTGVNTFNAAKGRKNPRAALQAPNGTYYGHIRRARLSEIGKANNRTPIIEILIVIVCHAGDDNFAAGDISFAGEQPRALLMLGASKNATAEENQERAMYTLQDLGYDTQFLILDESLRQSNDEYTLLQLLDDMNSTGLFVKISLSDSEDKQSRYTNIRGVVTADELRDILGGTDPMNIIGNVQIDPATNPETGEVEQYDYSNEQTQPAPAGGVAEQYQDMNQQAPFDAGQAAAGTVYSDPNSPTGYCFEDGSPCSLEGVPYEPPAPAAPPARPAPVQRPTARPAPAAAPAATTAPAAAPAPQRQVQRPQTTAPTNPQPAQRAVAAAPAVVPPARRTPPPPPPRRS